MAYLATISSTIAFATYIILLSIPPNIDPNSWNNLNWNHIGILPVVIFFISLGMIFLLVRYTKRNGKIICSIVILTPVYSLLFLTIYRFDQGNIFFNGIILAVFMVMSWLLGLIPFFWKNGSLTVAADLKNYLLLTTSLMWLCPLITEMGIWLSWYSDGTFAEKTVNSVLGGNGFNDFLFILGFTTLLFSGVLAVLRPKIADFMISRKQIVPRRV